MEYVVNYLYSVEGKGGLKGPKAFVGDPKDAIYVIRGGHGGHGDLGGHGFHHRHGLDGLVRVMGVVAI